MIKNTGENQEATTKDFFINQDLSNLYSLPNSILNYQSMSNLACFGFDSQSAI